MNIACFDVYRCQNGRTLLETRAQQHSPHRAANVAFIAITIQHIVMHCAGWVAAGARRSRVIPCNPTSHYQLQSPALAKADRRPREKKKFYHHFSIVKYSYLPKDTFKKNMLKCM